MFVCVFVCVYVQITWLEGHSLAQTVFTCLYVHNPDLIEEPALKAFALGILKVCDIAREKVNKAAVFEEVSIFYFTLCVLDASVALFKSEKSTL